MTKRSLSVMAAAMCAACGSEGPTEERFAGPIAARDGTVLVEGCAIDSWQEEQLASDSAHRVLSAVTLLCPAAHASGDVGPTDASDRASLAAQLSAIRQLGYEARVAVTMADESGSAYTQAQIAAALASGAWRSSVAQQVAQIAEHADGVDLQLPAPPDASRDDVTALVKALSQAVAPQKLTVLAPPATPGATDVAGAAAFDLRAIGPLVARVRLLTLDYSCCGSGPGPTIDSGWAVDVERYGRARTNAAFDVAVPLYGWDFGPQGQRSVTWDEAVQVATTSRATMRRGPGGAVFYDWTDGDGGGHETWFDDAMSTSWTLHAWDTTAMPPDVGVLYWGLGAEDPSTWDTIARESAP